jgi:hypothetical protein
MSEVLRTDVGQKVTGPGGQIPELVEDAIQKNRQAAEQSVANLREYVERGVGDVGACIQWACEALRWAVDAGVNVKDLEAQFLELEKGALRQHAVKKIAALRQYVEQGVGGVVTCIQGARVALQWAADAGVNVKDLKAQFLELEKDAIRRNAVEQVAVLRQFAEKGVGDAGTCIQGARMALREAKTAGVNIKDLEAEMPGLVEAALTRTDLDQ